MSQEIYSRLSNSLILGDPDSTENLTKQALDAGIEPMEIINNGLIPGMNTVGEKFSTGEYFLPDLIIAGEGMQRAMDLLEPELKARQQSITAVGIVVLGTVKGDIHEIGKSLVGTMLSANGFKVYDLGVDVDSKKFIEKIEQTNADIVGLSALLTTTMTMQRQIINDIADAGLRDKVCVLVGGAPVTSNWSEEISADGYAEDAMGAVRVATELMKIR